MEPRVKPTQDDDKQETKASSENFPSNATFNDKTYPAIFEFQDESKDFLLKIKESLIKTLKSQRKKLPFWKRLKLGSYANIDNWVIIDNGQLKFTANACEAGAIELFFKTYSYGEGSAQADSLQRAVSYLSFRASKTSQYYSFFGRLFGVSRQKRCDDTWDLIQSIT